MKLYIKKSTESKKIKFEAIKAKILKHLEMLEKENVDNIQKSFDEMLIIMKGGRGLPVGTIREWKGKKFIKIAPGKWKPKYDSHTKGAKLAISALKKKIKACNDEQEMMQIVLENRDRFTDKNGHPLPFVQELYNFIQENNNSDKKVNPEEASRNRSEAMKGNQNAKKDGVVQDEKTNFTKLSKVLESGKSSSVKHKELGEIIIDAGSTGKSGYGLKHIIEQRYMKDGKDEEEITALLSLVLDATKDGEVVRNNERIIEVQKNGVIAILRKENEERNSKWLLTGFDNWDNKEVATDAIKTVIANNSYAPEYSSFRSQVGAVIASLESSMPQNKGIIKKFEKMEEKRKEINKEREKVGMPQLALFERESAIKDSTWNPNSEDYRYKDTGYIEGSKKDIAKKKIASKQLEEMIKLNQQILESDIDWVGLEVDSNVASSLITKKNIFGNIDWQDLKEKGMSGSVAFLINKIYSSISSKPLDNPLARRNYVIALNTLRDRLEKCNSVADVEKTLTHIGFENQEKILGKNITNPLYNAWSSLGTKFNSINTSSSFTTQRYDAKYGKYDDWKWLDSSTMKNKEARKKPFELLVSKSFERIGGRNVKVNSTEELKKMFNLRDVQSGNWVLKDPDTAKFHVDHICEGFADLADVTGISDNLISLGGRLALAIGARGQGRFCAHYEPLERVINITKLRGGGALGHEWFHAFDNLINVAMGNSIATYATYLTQGGTAPYADEVREAFLKLYNAMTLSAEPKKYKYSYSDREYKNVQRVFNNISKKHHLFAVKNAKNIEEAISLIEKHYEEIKAPIKKEIIDINTDYYDIKRGEKKLNKLAKDRLDEFKLAYIYFTGKEGGGEVEIPTDKREPSSFYKEAVNCDSGHADKYWSSIHEMAARAFSAYLEDSLKEMGRKNDYLASDTSNSIYTKDDKRPYPEGKERENINKAFKNLFEVVKKTNAIKKAIDNHFFIRVKKSTLNATIKQLKSIHV